MEGAGLSACEVGSALSENLALREPTGDGGGKRGAEVGAGGGGGGMEAEVGTKAGVRTGAGGADETGSGRATMERDEGAGTGGSETRRGGMEKPPLPPPRAGGGLSSEVGAASTGSSGWTPYFLVWIRRRPLDV